LSQQEILNLKQAVSAKIIGQQGLIDRLLIAILADGHLLVEGAPGLAKTRAIKVLGEGIEGDFHRVQFTPDLLPADLTGTEIYRPQDGSFKFQRGPLFHNLILADEINRAPAKVQAALLEAMEERQVTVAGTTHKMPALFMVMATQNPIEQEGTYPLPEAQMDRFLMHVMVDYGDEAAETKVIRLVRGESSPNAKTEQLEQIPQQAVFDARAEIGRVHTSEDVERYMVDLVFATWNPKRYTEQLDSWIEIGASPRGAIGLDKCARVHAWLDGRDYVSPNDVCAVVNNVLRHRLKLGYEANAEGITAGQVVTEIVNQVAVP